MLTFYKQKLNSFVKLIVFSFVALLIITISVSSYYQNLETSISLFNENIYSWNLFRNPTYLNPFSETFFSGIFFFFWVIIFFPFIKEKTVKQLALIASILFWFKTLILTLNFNPYETNITNVTFIWNWFSDFNLKFYFTVDGINILLILLVAFLAPINILIIWKETKRIRLLISSIFLIQTCLVFIFGAIDLISFFFFFEIMLLPMLLIIGVWGPGFRKIRANFYFLGYTLVGSLFLLLGLILIYLEIGSLFFYKITFISLIQNEFKVKLIWFLLFLAFSTKIPVFLLHLWLPEAHVEAPTVGSVILAALLLKTGGYGMMKFLLPLSTFSTEYFFPLAISLFLISVYYCSFLSLIELDIKRIIAYSSIVHMNGALLGLFSGTVYGIQGFILIMVAHGLVSAALFILIGQLYERHHSKSILFYGGLAQIMPRFTFFLSIFIFANFSCPGSLNFVGELLVYFGIFLLSKKIALLYIISALVSTAYSIYFLSRICFGSLKTIYINSFQDLTERETFVAFWILIPTFFFGFFPQWLLDITYISSLELSQYLMI